MKVVELLAERQKIKNLLNNIKFYKSAPICPPSVFMSDMSDVRKETYTEQDFNRNYEKAMKLLKRMDELNNALHESDSQHYIEVMGIRLSVATARQYIEELYNEDEDELLGFENNSFSCIAPENFRWNILNKCILWRKDNPESSSTSATGSEDEFEEKKLNWYLGLKTAVIISDANTEVAFCD